MSATWSAYFLSSGPRAYQCRHARVRLERVGVGDAGDVDGQAGVAVDVPGAAEVVLALEDHEVVDAQPLELDGRAHAAEARADDDRLVLLAMTPSY